MKNKAKLVGVFGGSFDPPHLGHRILIEQALKVLQPDQIWLIPAGSPVHRNLSGKASAEQRFCWVEQTFDGLPEVIVQRWEIDHQAVPTIETLRFIAQSFPEVTPVWLMGLDAWQQMHGWVGYPEHTQLCNVMVFQRGEDTFENQPGWQVVSPTIFSSKRGRQEVLTGTGQVIPVQAEIPDISATMIRDRLSESARDNSSDAEFSLHGMVHPSVALEIQAAYAE